MDEVMKEFMGSQSHKTEIDYDYLKQIEGNDDALYEYIEKEFVYEDYKSNKGHSFKNKCKGMRQICKILGLEPSQDQFIFVMAEYPYINNQAVAGAGKTTFSQLRAIKEKFLNKVQGAEILSIAYNRRAAEDMKIRHEQLINKLNEKYKGTAFHLDSYIETYTYHSFANFLVDEYKTEYSSKLGVILKEKDYLIMDSEVRNYMNQAVERFFKMNCTDQSVEMKYRKASNQIVSDLISIYAWRTETLNFDYKDAEKANGYTNLIDTFGNNVNIDSIFQHYKNIKAERCVCDYSDLLDFSYLLLTEKSVMDRIRKLFKYIIFDEFQDTSNNMFRSIALICKGDPALGIPESDIKLTVIGDSDQMLYAFRGVDLNTSLNFKEVFGEDKSKVLSMAINRRCLEPIVELSDSIIKNNKKRIVKPVLSIRPMSLEPDDLGKSYEDCKYKAVQPFVYKNESEYIDKIVADLREMNYLELGETAIIYRNRVSSVMIARRLFKENIPFKVSRGIAPYEDALSRAILGSLALLNNPTNSVMAANNLPRLLPKSRGVTNFYIREVCKRERVRFAKDADAELLNFWDYHFNISDNNVNFHNRLKQLREISLRVRKGESMTTLVPDILDLIDMRALKFSDSMPPEYVIPDIIEDFKSEEGYRDFYSELTRKLDEYKDKSDSFHSVELTTFHSTKGLEFDNVYIIDLEDGQFPGRELDECDGDLERIDDAIESCRRLFYVAVTRARNKLVLCISANNPSRFISELPEKFIPNDVQNILHDGEIPATEEKINLVEKADQFTSVPDEMYLKNLNVISLTCGDYEIKGYFDGFIHAGDYEYDNKQQEDYAKKVEKAESILDSDVFSDIFGNDLFGGDSNE